MDYDALGQKLQKVIECDSKDVKKELTELYGNATTDEVQLLYCTLVDGHYDDFEEDFGIVFPDERQKEISEHVWDIYFGWFKRNIDDWDEWDKKGDNKDAHDEFWNY